MDQRETRDQTPERNREGGRKRGWKRERKRVRVTMGELKAVGEPEGLYWRN